MLFVFLVDMVGVLIYLGVDDLSRQILGFWMRLLLKLVYGWRLVMRLIMFLGVEEVSALGSLAILEAWIRRLFLT